MLLFYLTCHTLPSASTNTSYTYEIFQLHAVTLSQTIKFQIFYVESRALICNKMSFELLRSLFCREKLVRWCNSLFLCNVQCRVVCWLLVGYSPENHWTLIFPIRSLVEFATPTPNSILAHRKCILFNIYTTLNSSFWLGNKLWQFPFFISTKLS